MDQSKDGVLMDRSRVFAGIVPVGCSSYDEL